MSTRLPCCGSLSCGRRSEYGFMPNRSMRGRAPLGSFMWRRKVGGDVEKRSSPPVGCRLPPITTTFLRAACIAPYAASRMRA